jgi:hypothetical protein
VHGGSNVHGNQNLGTPAGGNSGKKETQRKILENGNKTYGGVIAFLDELANGVSYRVGFVCRLAKGEARVTGAAGCVEPVAEPYYRLEGVRPDTCPRNALNALYRPFYMAFGQGL